MRCCGAWNYADLGCCLSNICALGPVRPTTLLRGQLLDGNAESGSRCPVELLLRGLNEFRLFLLKIVFVILLSHACISVFLVSAFCIVSLPDAVPYYLYVVHADVRFRSCLQIHACRFVVEMIEEINR